MRDEPQQSHPKHGAVRIDVGVRKPAPTWGLRARGITGYKGVNMLITLTPEIEQALNEYAEKQGTTIESLALGAIREKFPCHQWIRQESRKPKVETLADRLAPYIGVISSSEVVPGGANLSVDGGKKFAQGLLEKRERGRL
uniref:Uncharacterized protein n=3 Tax=Candidatus Kentrum sp. TC TaxID=2126339 RepID=A0A451ACF0_9GAMM|nr:MAG: hypothetical protein BECKTC1821F_GA0114240_11042 [Candidatus Kentron sp. TC]